MRKVILMLLVLMLSISALTGCGGDSDDPDLGLWKAVTGEMLGISMEVEDFFTQGFTIELKARGRCTLSVDGESANGRWTLENGVFTVSGGGLDGKGRLENDKLTLEDVLGTGLTLIFYKDGIVPASERNAEAEADDADDNDNAVIADDTANDAALSEKREWWDGDWYGYWVMVSGDDPYIGGIGRYQDCYAIINVNDDYTATILLFDDVIRIGEVEVEIVGDYPDFMGVAEAVGGEMFYDPLGDLDWSINPGFSGHENMIMIDNWYTDDYGDRFRYQIFLRPWGMLWDDVPDDERPPYYDWYLSVIDMTMDEAIASLSDGGGGTESGDAVTTEINSPDGKEGTMSVSMPDGWYDHSMTDVLSGFLKFSESDDPWDDGYPNVDIRQSWLMGDTLLDAFIYEGGISIGFTFDDREWIGIYVEDGFGLIELLTDIGEGCYVAITVHGLHPDDDEVQHIIKSLRVRWN